MEEWRSVPGHPEHFQVSSMGRVRNTRTGNTLKAPPNKHGYCRFQYRLNGKIHTVKIHRAMALAFELPGVGPYVRHLDDDKMNNSLENLSWGTQTDNMKDALRNGKLPSALIEECKRGHEFSEQNTYISQNRKNGSTRRNCRECKRIRRQKHE